MTEGKADQSQASERPRASGTSRLEWAVAAIGALLLLGTVGYMGHYGLTQSDEPPAIALVQGPIGPAPGGFVVQFTARNDGQSTAAALQVKGLLLTGGQVLEESEATIDYVPEQSEREGGLFFTRNPSLHELRLQAGGYAKP